MQSKAQSTKYEVYRPLLYTIHSTERETRRARPAGSLRLYWGHGRCKAFEGPPHLLLTTLLLLAVTITTCYLLCSIYYLRSLLRRGGGWPSKALQ